MSSLRRKGMFVYSPGAGLLLYEIIAVVDTDESYLPIAGLKDFQIKTWEVIAEKFLQALEDSGRDSDVVQIPR